MKRWMTKEEIQARIAELDRQIDAVPQWGAVLTVMDEERRGLIRMLESTDYIWRAVDVELLP